MIERRTLLAWRGNTGNCGYNGLRFAVLTAERRTNRRGVTINLVIHRFSNAVQLP